MEKALFLDRDGVINVDYDYVHKIEEFDFFDGVFNTCREFKREGYLIVVITNQSGISRQKYSENDFTILTEWMKEEFAKNGASLSTVQHCPHHPDITGECSCRKPKPGMIELACEELNIDPSQSLLVGDHERDIEAGINAGIKCNIRVKSGREDIDLKMSKANKIVDSLKDINPNALPCLK